MKKLLIIDNYDSFTWNLYQYFCELGKKVEVVQNDKIDILGIKQISPSHIVISPGPGLPINAGISLSAISHFSRKIPILGVCLGHQAIGQVFNAQIVQARKVMHGKISTIHHNGSGVFLDIINPLKVVRYHSLVLDKESIPSCLIITAWTETYDVKLDEIMGIRHCVFPVEGVQFHPESIKSEKGRQLLLNFLNY